MQILEEAIKYRWGALPEEQRQGIRNYISNLIIKISSSESTFRSEKVFLNKLNIILVQVGSIFPSVGNAYGVKHKVKGSSRNTRHCHHALLGKLTYIGDLDLRI